MAANDAGGVDRLLGAQTRSYDAVFSDKKENGVIKPSDFLNLMVAQMKNQDFLNPMDETQFVTQMAQFSTMQQMMELAEYSKTNYAMSLVGKTVTASRFNVSGGLDTVTGVVERIALYDNDYILYIADPRYPDDDTQRRYYLSQVMEVHAGSTGGTGGTNQGNGTEGSSHTSTNPGVLDASTMKVTAGEPTDNAVVLFWDAPKMDANAATGLEYTVYYSTEGPFVSLKDVKEGTAYTGVDGSLSTKVATIPGLEPGTIYYFNVVVKDAKGNETVYQPAVVMTTGGAKGAATNPVTPPPTGTGPTTPVDPTIPGEPGDEEDDPLDGVAEPGDGSDDPTDGATEPGDGGDDPIGGVTDPDDGGDDPVGGVTDPDDGGDDPVGGVTDPDDGGTDPVDSGGDPDDGGADPGDGAP